MENGGECMKSQLQADLKGVKNLFGWQAAIKKATFRSPFKRL